MLRIFAVICSIDHLGQHRNKWEFMRAPMKWITIIDCRYDQGLELFEWVSWAAVVELANVRKLIATKIDISRLRDIINKCFFVFVCTWADFPVSHDYINVTKILLLNCLLYGKRVITKVITHRPSKRGHINIVKLSLWTSYIKVLLFKC